MTTKIEWCDETWNPVTGCDKVSAGCDHCYAETIAHRFAGTKSFPNGFAVTLHPERLEQPLRWRKPRRVFVNSMSDLFHDEIPDDFLEQVFATMAAAPQHTFQILTKRHARMRSFLRQSSARVNEGKRPFDHPYISGRTWPLPNVWLGVSAEDQKWADVRIPVLLDTPAVIRFVSAEPLLGPIDVGRYVRPVPKAPDFRAFSSRLDWVIVGGESGRGARPMDPQWARSLRDQCQTARIAFLFKQWGEWVPTRKWAVGILENDEIYGSASEEWPHGLRGHEVIKRLGKKYAGRELDGRTWDQYPDEVTQ